MKYLFLVLATLSASTANAALLRCQATDPLETGHEYLLVTNKEKGAIFRLENPGSNWTSLYTDATVNEQADRLTVNGHDNTQINWNSPEHRNSCFERLNDALYFRLQRQNSKLSGELQMQMSLSINPNKDPRECPIPNPMLPRPIALVCKKLR